MNENRTTSVILSTGILVMNILCILLILNLLSDNFGIAPSSLIHLITIFLLLGVTLLNLPLKHTVQMAWKKSPFQVTLTIGLILLIAAFLLFIFSNTQLLWLSSVPLLLSGLILCLSALGRTRKELHFLGVASFVYIVVFLLVQTIPSFWSFLQQCSLGLSYTIGSFFRIPLLLGPTASGLGIVLVFLVFLFSIFLLLRKKAKKDFIRVALGAGGILVVWFFYLLLLGYVSYETKSDAISLHPVFFLLCLIPTFWYLIMIRSCETSPGAVPLQRPPKTQLKSKAVLMAVLLFLSTMVLTIFVGAGSPSVEHPKIIFYADHMLGTWDVPEYGKYGKDAVGMFGLWPVYLTTLGYETELLVENRTTFLDALQGQTENITRYLNLSDYLTIIEIEQITHDLLNDASVFVVSNLNVSFSDEEQSVIWEYVQKGGSLLVLGDHTDVGGIQTPLNDLLSPVGIRFRFDAALPLDDRHKWLTCTHLLPHPITASLPGLDTLQYGIGASLDTSLSSFPIIIGTYALSDEGNQSNEDIAYLGDYEYTKGEQLGDVTLVAGAYYGDGKVLVFGDTSTFQNAALAFSYPFIQSIFAWLTNSQTAFTNLLQLGVALLLLGAALFIYRLWRDTTGPFTLYPVLLCVSLLLTTSLNPLLIHDSAVHPGSTSVTIDASHGERFTLDSFTDDSVNGLIVNLQRNNYLPMLLKRFSKEHISASKILICIAPTLPFSVEEVAYLKQYMQNGGFVILATGYEDKEASLPLLHAYGVDVGQTPLGPVPYVESNTTLYQNEPRFVDSWPLLFQQNRTVSYYNFSWEDLTFHLVIFVRQGNGGLLVIGDSQYLLDKNIESIYDYWPGNILFLKYLLDELRDMEDVR